MNLTKLFNLLVLLFFWMMLVIPTIYQLERGAILALLLASSLVYLLITNNWRLHKEIALIAGMCVIASISFMLVGAYHNAPGALRVGTVYVLWPLIFIYFIGFFRHPEQIFPFLKVIVVAEVCAAIIGILYVSEAFGFLDLGVSTLVGDEKAGVGIIDGSVGYSLPNLTTIIYSFPFLLSTVILPKQISDINENLRIVVWLGLLLAVIVLLISGRRAFWVIAAISPLVVIVFSFLCNVKIETKKISLIGLTVIFVAIFAIVFFDIHLEVVWNDILSGFDFSSSDDISTYIRKQQYSSLLNGWMENPILGAGLGSGASMIRDIENPWAYELTYLALLFQTGVLGIAIYGSAVIWIFVRGVAAVRKQPIYASVLIPLLSGLACFLIANVTNPYLQKFDYLWTLFLPVAVINTYFISNRNNKVL